MHSLSKFYGSPVSANAFPQYSDAELERDLEKNVNALTRTNIEAELARRAAARKARKARRARK